MVVRCWCSSLSSSFWFLLCVCRRCWAFTLLSCVEVWKDAWIEEQQQREGKNPTKGDVRKKSVPPPHFHEGLACARAHVFSTGRAKNHKLRAWTIGFEHSRWTGPCLVHSFPQYRLVPELSLCGTTELAIVALVPWSNNTTEIQH
jgi:hypothetical protein